MLTQPAPPSDYWDGLTDETNAADFLCQSVRTLQKWRITGAGPAFYKSGRSIPQTAVRIFAPTVCAFSSGSFRRSRRAHTTV